MRLIEANAEDFALPELVDGLLCAFTHDIVVSTIALPNALPYPVLPRGFVMSTT